MRLSIRTILELAGSAILIGLLVWQVLTAAALRTSLAEARTAIKTEKLRTQAADASARSCTAALDQIQVATDALSAATRSAYAASDQAVQRASTRAQEVKIKVTDLLKVRVSPGQDCEAALVLGQAAWKEGQ